MPMPLAMRMRWANADADAYGETYGPRTHSARWMPWPSWTAWSSAFVHPPTGITSTCVVANSGPPPSTNERATSSSFAWSASVSRSFSSSWRSGSESTLSSSARRSLEPSAVASAMYTEKQCHGSASPTGRPSALSSQGRWILT